VDAKPVLLELMPPLVKMRYVLKMLAARWVMQVLRENVHVLMVGKALLCIKEKC